MGLIRNIQMALREGLDEMLGGTPPRDEVDEVTALLEGDSAEAKAALDVALGDQQRLQARLDQETRDAERLHTKAKEAVDAGDDDGARELIRRRRRVLRGVEILEQQWTDHQQLIATVRDHLEQLEDKLQEVRLRRDYLRTRHRVRALQERFERYRRDFDLDEEAEEQGTGPHEPGSEAEHAAVSPADLLQRMAEELGAVTRRRRGQVEPEPEPLHGMGEVPRPAEGDEPQLRPTVPDEPAAPGGEPEGESEESPWDRPPRSITLERERLLRDIERRHGGAEFEAAIDEELRRLKSAAAPPAPEKQGDEPGPGA
jgi:phage shock protein A